MLRFKKFVMLSLAVSAMAAGAAQARAPGPAYPSCDLPAQRALAAPTGGAIKDPRQAHISMRGNILQADIGSARKARRITQAQARRLFARVETVRRDTDRFVRKQGFLSAAERASYDRELDEVAGQICGLRRTGR